MFSARGVALNVTTASVQLRMLQNSVYLLRGQSYRQLTVVMRRTVPILDGYSNGQATFRVALPEREPSTLH
jgi:hypothetical protein